jgi:membrane fusion protein (multidrug efflux system)
MKRKFLFILFTGSLLAGILLTGCKNNKAEKQPPARVKTETATATFHTFYDEIKGFGTIRAVQTLDLEAKFNGIVHFRNRTGRIKKGSVIYTITGPEADLKRENLEKKLAVAQSQYRYYKEYYEAKKKLAEKNFLSRIEFEKVTRDLQKAQNGLNNARYALSYFQAMTRYKAPFDGYLDNLQVPQGEDAAAGQLLGTFQDDDHLKLVAPWYGNTAGLPQGNLVLRIEDNRFQGKITYVEKAVNPSTGGHTLWITLNDPGHLLKSGNYVPYAFLTNKRRSVAVPEPAVIFREGHFYVIGLENGHYKKTEVVPGQTDKGLTEIKKGLSNGTVVLTKGAFEVFYGNLTKTMNVED